MQTTVFPGLTFTYSLEIERELNAPCRDGDGTSNAGAPIVATGLAVAFVEWACNEALRPYLDPGETTAGTRIAFQQSGEPAVGARVTAHVELIEIRGRKFRFQVAARDEFGIIGQGLHERVLRKIGTIMPRALTHRVGDVAIEPASARAAACI